MESVWHQRAYQVPNDKEQRLYDFYMTVILQQEGRIHPKSEEMEWMHKRKSSTLV